MVGFLFIWKKFFKKETDLIFVGRCGQLVVEICLVGRVELVEVSLVGRVELVGISEEVGF